jgi:hypothetical protein
MPFGVFDGEGHTGKRSIAEQNGSSLMGKIFLSIIYYIIYILYNI